MDDARSVSFQARFIKRQERPVVCLGCILQRTTRDGFSIYCQAVRIFQSESGRHCVSVLDLILKSGRTLPINGKFSNRDYELDEPCERIVYIDQVQYVAAPPASTAYFNARGQSNEDANELKRLERACPQPVIRV